MNFRIISILFFTLLLNNSLYSQVFDTYGYSNLHSGFDKKKSIIGINADYFYGSTAIKNSLTKALIKNSFINDDLKNSSSLKDFNKYGNYFQSNIYYAYMGDTLFGIPNLGMRFGLNYYSMQNINFSQDFYNLMFYGNKQYEDKYADISKLDINTLTYQSFEFGLFKRFAEKNNGYHTVYFGLSLIKGQNYMYLYTNDARLFTAPDGEFIELTINSSYFASDSTKSTIATLGGMGASLNFYWAYEDIKHNSRFEITLTDLGLISWFDNPLYYSADTTIRFDGQEIDDIFNPETGNKISQDSILQLIYSSSDNKTFLKSLPKRFQFAYTKRFLNNKYIPTLGMGYFFNSNQFMPAIFLNNKFVMSPYMNFDFLFSYGGYTGFSLGLGVGFNIIESLKINIVSPNIVGAIIPNRTYSNGAFIGLSYRF